MRFVLLKRIEKPFSRKSNKFNLDMRCSVLSSNCKKMLLMTAALVIVGCSESNKPADTAKDNAAATSVASGDGQGENASATVSAESVLSSSSAEIGVADTGSGEVEDIAAKQKVSGGFRAPADGSISAFYVTIGNYAGASDGDVSAELCAASGCVNATSNLTGSRDNEYFKFTFSSNLVVAKDEVLKYTITRQSGTAPFAIWLYASGDTSLMSSYQGIKGSSGKIPRLAVTFVP
jgi:hypothetical protein